MVSLSEIAEQERDHVAKLLTDHLRDCQVGCLSCCVTCESLRSHLIRTRRQVMLFGQADAVEATGELALF